MSLSSFSTSVPSWMAFLPVIRGQFQPAQQACPASHPLSLPCPSFSRIRPEWALHGQERMNPSFLPAHHPPKAVIRDVLRGGLQVVFGGGLVVQQRPTAGLAVGLLAQAVGEGVVPGEKDRCELRGLRSQQPRCIERPEGPDPEPQLVVAPLPLPQQEALAGTTLPYLLLPKAKPVSPSCSGLGQAEHGRVWREKGGVGLQGKLWALSLM